MKIADILTGKKILIWGYGREGKSTEHFILDHNIDCEYDIFEGKYEDIDCDKYDIIVKSPGIKCHEDNIKSTPQFLKVVYYCIYVVHYFKELWSRLCISW